MGNVLRPDFWTTQDVHVSNVREAAVEACPEKLLCIGIDKDGDPYYAASFSNGHELLWMVEQFKHKLLSGKFS